jgi:2-keto-3-deoxy-L-rhamnonate aldolase RhmA
MAVTLSDARRWLELGAQFISIGVDLDILKSGAAAMESSLAQYRSGGQRAKG